MDACNSRKGTTETLEVNVRFLYSMAHNFNIALQDDLPAPRFRG